MGFALCYSRKEESQEERFKRLLSSFTQEQQKIINKIVELEIENMNESGIIKYIEWGS